MTIEKVSNYLKRASRTGDEEVIAEKLDNDNRLYVETKNLYKVVHNFISANNHKISDDVLTKGLVSVESTLYYILEKTEKGVK